MLVKTDLIVPIVENLNIFRFFFNIDYSSTELLLIKTIRSFNIL